MNELMIQRTRAMLQSRVRRVRTVGPAMFPSACALFLSWLADVPILAGLEVQLGKEAADIAVKLQEVLNDPAQLRRKATVFVPGTEHEAVLNGYAALTSAARCESEDANAPASTVSPSAKLTIIAQMLTGESQNTYQATIEAICTYALEPLFDYLDEQLDARNVTLAILRQYKDRSELLRAGRLRAMADGPVEGQVGERAIVLDLYEYLHDQGIRFIIEPVHADGRPDAVLARSAGDEAIIDAKLVRDVRSAKRTIAAGIRQVATYCRAHSEPVGYLLVYATTPFDVVFADGSNDDGFRCVRMGECTVYYVDVNIADGPSASRKYKAPEIVITRDDLSRADLDALQAT